LYQETCNASDTYQRAEDLVLNAPSPVDKRSLGKLHLALLPEAVEPLDNEEKEH
jgi:hypothetical protein